MTVEHDAPENPPPPLHSHDDQAKASPAKAIGVTMALLGVMLALCAAFVGTARTELIRNAIAQANHYSELQSETTKFRVMEADYEMLHAVTPNRAELLRFERKLTEVRAKNGKGDDEDTAEIKDAVDVSTRELVDLVTPDKDDEDRLLAKKRRYAREAEEAKEDAEGYDLVIAAYGDAARGFERAQLCAEVALVIAAMSLLLSNRLIWAVSIALGLACGTVAGTTALSERDRLALAEAKIKAASAHAGSREGVERGEGEGTDGAAAPK